MSNRKDKAYQRMGHNETSDEENDAIYSTPRRPKGTGGRKGSVASDGASQQLLQLTAKRSLSSVSVTLANLPLDERNFLVLVEDGSVSAVDRFLEDHPYVNVNCRDIHGISALHRAVRSEDFEMIGFLINRPNVYAGDTTLHAVELGNTEVVTLLLEGLRKRDKRLEFHGVQDSVDFTPDITPLMLAAHLNDFNMVKLLVDRGHSIVRPHPPGCLCGRAECSGNKSKEFAKLEYSKRRYNSYQALCSPAYLSQTSKDVIKTCFKLCSELYSCSKKEAEFAEKYLELSAKLKEFVKQLLEQCSTTEEVELILKQRHMGAPCNAIFPRIYLALQCRQREFIAHENCQQVLQAAWLDEWQDWRGMSVLSKLLRLLMRLILFPFLALVYILMPRPIQWLERYMRPPIHRYLLSTSSYLAFLILVFIVISHDREAKYRGPPQSGLEWGIIVYVLGYSWDAFKRFQLQRAHTFFASWWNIYDLLDLLLFYCTFGIWYELWQRQATVPPKDRMEWEWDDPVLVAESLFAFATILAFGKLLQIFRVDRRMGPLLISLGKMVFDMIRFLVVYVCVVLSFSTGLSNMYETYHDQIKANADGTNTTQSDAFMTFPKTAKTLFWALFGLAPAEGPDVIIGNRHPNGSIWKDYQAREHSFTQASGYIMFGMYQVIGILILLNTLIAVMSNTYQKVADNSDAEWKFARTQIWVNYFDHSHSLPTPFNMIPTVRTVTAIIATILRKDQLDTKEALLMRQMSLRYSELQGRLTKTIFSKIEREKATEQLANLQKDVQRLLDK